MPYAEENEARDCVGYRIGVYGSVEKHQIDRNLISLFMPCGDVRVVLFLSPRRLVLCAAKNTVGQKSNRHGGTGEQNAIGN